MKRNIVGLQGFNIDTFSFDEALEFANSISGQVVTINPEMIANARSDKDFASIINNAELVIPDGIGVQIGLKILGYNVQRIAGIEFAYKIMELCAENRKSVAFIGAKPEIIDKVVENIKSKIQNINIVYTHDGYFEDEIRVLNELRDKNPRLVLCALGSPKQEFFIAKTKKLLPNALFIGVGGSFDVWSGVVQRAPEIYQKAGLEWLYRTVKEPQRFKRIFPTLPLFVFNVLKEKFIPKGI